jgi:hypothetical protein
MFTRSRLTVLVLVGVAGCMGYTAATGGLNPRVGPMQLSPLEKQEIQKIGERD